jgi:hypothetical protein
VIPVQYKVGAGASNKAVGLSVKVISSITQNADLQDIWNADYANFPPPKGPTLGKSGEQTSANQISIVTNNFDKGNNENNGHWYSNQSFGIETGSGFIGMTWDPKAGQTRQLTPKLTFYVAIGEYGENTLASWDQFSNAAAEIHAPTDFSKGSCTVTYTKESRWKVTPGEPLVRALAKNLDWFLSDEHQELVALAHLSRGDFQSDTIVTTHWDTNTLAVNGDEIIISGTLTVATALTAAFTYFILASTKFDVKRDAAGKTTVDFSFNGPGTASHIMGLFAQGASVVFGGAT